MTQNELFSIIECILFVAGEPVPIVQLQEALALTKLQMQPLLAEMEQKYREEGRGIQLFITDDAVQMMSNREYISYVEAVLQPIETKSFSKSVLETLSIVAYKQPVTRSEIEAIRGVRCEYSVAQLLKQGLICEVGRKNTVGRPVLLGTTDVFLREFGLHSIYELPDYEALRRESDSDTDFTNEFLMAD